MVSSKCLHVYITTLSGGSPVKLCGYSIPHWSVSWIFSPRTYRGFYFLKFYSVRVFHHYGRTDLSWSPVWHFLFFMYITCYYNKRRFKFISCFPCQWHTHSHSFNFPTSKATCVVSCFPYMAIFPCECSLLIFRFGILCSITQIL